MITKCIGRDFKGLSFEQPLGRLNLFIGPNGSGKSARTQALILAVMGYIPGGAKKNAEILGAYGTEDTMVVGFEADVLFERGFVRSGGAVSPGYQSAGGRVKEGEFQKSMALHGNPRIVDVSAFMELSDQKKIDAVFSLYPPAGDITKIQGEIDSAKEKINGLVQKAKTSEAAAARLVAAKPPLPAGTLADVTGKLVETAESLRVARKELVDAQVAEGARLAKEKAEKKAAEDALKLKEKQEKQALVDAQKAKDEAEKKERERIAAEEKAMKELDEKVAASLAVRPGEMTKECDRMLGPLEAKFNKEGFAGIGGVKYPTKEEGVFLYPGELAKQETVAASITAILDALKAAGCESCAARLVAIRELRKFQGVKS
jgi:energy-coupling factor transporter ATP-binding protein EcfA2